MKRLIEWMSPDLVSLDLDAADLDAVLAALGDLAVRGGVAAAADRVSLVKALEERELLASTSLKHGVAVPHAYLDIVKREGIGVLRTAKPVPFNGPPADLFLLVTGPSRRAAEHLQVLARLARLLREDKFLDRLRSAKTPDEVLTAFREAEAGGKR